jgi:anti-anti-sigma regulatory factor
VLGRASKHPQILILNFENVPLIDATGARIIRQLVSDKNISVILTNLKADLFKYFSRLDYNNGRVYGYITKDMREAVRLANKLNRNFLKRNC